jgi:GAF domain-containing protein
MTSDSSLVELTTAFARLQGLLLDTQSATAAVSRLAEVARDLIPLAVGAGVTLIDADGVPASTAATDPAVEAVDRMQYELGEGPCLSAWDTVSLQRVEDTLTEVRWPEWAAAAAATGVRSVLSAPLVHRGQEIGAVKVYAAEPEAFTEHEEHLLVLLATAAATLLGAAQSPQSVHRLSTELKSALADRQQVQAAVGILMERHDLDADAAHTRLLVAARRQGVPLLGIAARVVGRADDPRL